ncbi:metal ABC transporter ATP-binding protein [Sulfurospirillum diekertiae]|uniref:High-affinity zinc uptake system ATP-binding protein ZnuC n=1 Tax=Sulfurospirillum diekertiae TaxID=1854492 RepID=A0A1Y0HPR3_9BACT|nr:metal ABC transporter ATP-binding protein [Sulfurospirillum diekertiae]ARU49193.1 High-affinity zinc uptake system ATP-binding protein ZnuC [Sulfurospirillum diekertiae]ASC94003.1 High-affinity zinc uptake system ATP-binding protein ZnuC [Sulfurospirillum diekertiae]
MVLKNFKDNVIEAKNLNFKTIIQNVTFEIRRGDYAAIIGPNGGGKSTLVKLILGLIPYDSGTIKLFGKTPTLSALKKIGYVSQGISKLDENFPISVHEVVKLGLIANKSLFARINRSDLEIIDRALIKMNIEDLKDAKISELSGGQRQRVMIAKALVNNPQILILDEPNTGVDKQSQINFYALLKDLNVKENITILFITHDLGVIVDDINKVLCINQTLLACHDPRQIYHSEQLNQLYGVDAHMVCHHH